MDLVIEQAHPALSVDERALKARVRQAAHGEGHTLRFLSIVLADHDAVLALNRTYLGHDFHTDVLSFDLSDAEDARVVDGELYVDLDTARERHAEFGSTFEQEVHRYVLHGLLHLMGYDDATPEQQATMRRLEDGYLAEAPGDGEREPG